MITYIPTLLVWMLGILLVYLLAKHPSIPLAVGVASLSLLIFGLVAWLMEKWQRNQGAS